MPVSDYHAVSDIMGEIQRLSPKSVLDLGVGFGKWGVLCREILDARFGRCQESQWHTKIVGHETFKGYRNVCWAAYDCVHLWDFARELPWANAYELTLMIDSLEHIEPERGREVLNHIVTQCPHVIVSVPNGPMSQDAVFGNPYEAHRWTFNGTEEFEPYNFKLIHQSVCTVVSIEGMKA